VLLDRDRGRIAIDPKGVLVDIEFELACALRNPDRIGHWADARRLKAAAKALARASRADAGRIA
jgi:streptomycin 6-kinase